MPASYRAINYGIRPAKAVERKMLGELFRRLYPFQRVTDYRYIGFGSIYFSDFQLVHRALGLTDMVSIERDEQAEECFRFNVPYRSIDLRFKKSTVVLPQLSWERRTIVWLDYDGKLDTDALADVDTVCTRAASGSMLVISVNAHPDTEPSAERRQRIGELSGEPFDLGAYRVQQLRDLVGDKIPPGITGKDLRGKGLCGVFCEIIMNQIAEVLATRNALLAAEERVSFRQVLYFEYKDGAQMMTFGGVLVSECELPLFEACAFDKVDFARLEAEPYGIKVPCLTGREIRHLNAQLPAGADTPLIAPGVPEEDIRAYAGMYRYFPEFTEILFG
jgi:hypothetical protein